MDRFLADMVDAADPDAIQHAAECSPLPVQLEFGPWESNTWAQNLGFSAERSRPHESSDVGLFSGNHSWSALLGQKAWHSIDGSLSDTGSAGSCRRGRRQGRRLHHPYSGSQSWTRNFSEGRIHSFDSLHPLIYWCVHCGTDTTFKDRRTWERHDRET